MEAPASLSGEQRDTWPDLTTAEGRLQASLALTSMRQRLTEACQARVCLGGRATGALGRMPGVLEEVLFALEASQPVYLAGGLGGATRAVCECLSGRNPEELTFERQVAHSPVYAEVHAALQSTQWAVDWEEIRRRLREIGVGGVAQGNGLSDKENEALGVTTNPDEIVFLVSRGLGNVFGRANRREVVALTRRVEALRAEVDRLKQQLGDGV